MGQYSNKMTRWTVLLGVALLFLAWHTTCTPLEVLGNVIGSETVGMTAFPETRITDTDSDDGLEIPDGDDVEDWLTKTISKFFILFLRLWVIIKASADGINLYNIVPHEV